MSDRWTVLEGDVRALLPTLAANSVDAVLSDVPYGFGSHQPTLKELRAYLDGGELDTGGDFMGHDWHVPSVAVWSEVLRICKPGAHALAFAGARTGDLISIGMRCGGFELRDTCMWMHGQGFPKSQDAAKAIDKAAGHWRGKAGAVVSGNSALSAPNYARTDKGDPVTAAAAAAGYGSALKPAFEPIMLARKPLDGTMVANLAKWGTGFLAIDACRIAYASEEDKAAAAAAAAQRSSLDQNIGRTVYGGFNNGPASLPDYLDKQALGRWPANVLLDEDAAALVDIASGGGASRFFFTSKASKADRDHGLTHRKRTAAAAMVQRADGSAGMNSPRVGAGRTSGAANDHCNVKPLDLVEWCAKLLLPPKRSTPRRILIPYCGSGSEMIGALRAGWDEVIGIERDPHFAELARDRLAHADKSHQPDLFGT